MSKRVTSSGCHFQSLEPRRLFAGGGLDASFGLSGKVTGSFGFGATDIAVQADSKVVMVGRIENDFAIARLNANGTVDTTFGSGDGLVTTDFGGRDHDEAQAVAIQPDGKIVVAGESLKTGITAKWAIARYNADGTPDSTFAGDGAEFVLGFIPTRGVSDLAIQPDGKIVFSANVGIKRGVLNISEFDFAVVRLLSDGSLDSTFGDNRTVGRAGYVVSDFGNEDSPHGLALAPDGKIVAAGDTGSFTDDYKIAVARYTTDGRLDSTFDGDGKLSTDLLTQSSANAVAVQSDGRVVITGYSNSGLVTTLRYSVAGELEAGFGSAGVFTNPSPTSDDGIAVFTQNDKVLVISNSGTVAGNHRISAIQYRSNGALDQSFGQNGIAIFGVESDLEWAFGALSPGGKLVMGAGQDHGMSLVRLSNVLAPPLVQLVNADASAADSPTSPDAGSIRVVRDGAYSFATRVYLTASGSATFGTDYTSTLRLAKTTKKVAKTSKGPSFTTAYIDIPAGRSFETVPINVISDGILETNEVANFALVGKSQYSLGTARTASVTIADKDQLKLNFQAAGQVLAGNGYVADLGLVYGDRGSGLAYGWDADNTANARNRTNSGVPLFINNSFNHLQKNGANRKWEVAVPNGLYEVTVTAGDPDSSASIFKLNLETTLAVSGKPSSTVFGFQRTIRVQVSDHRLTLTNASGSSNNKVSHIEIKAAAPGTVAGEVTPNKPLFLKPPNGGGGSGGGGGVVASRIFSLIEI
jgi:uncharacterized delta-60 repeat protein